MAKARGGYSVVGVDGRQMNWPAMGASQGVTYGEADAIISCSILTGAHPDYWQIVRDKDGMVMPPYEGPPAKLRKTGARTA